MNIARTSRGSVTVGLPKTKKYALVDRFGKTRGHFETALEAAEAANRIWPGVEQDEERTGNGWDIEHIHANGS